MTIVSSRRPFSGTRAAWIGAARVAVTRELSALSPEFPPDFKDARTIALALPEWEIGARSSARYGVVAPVTVILRYGWGRKVMSEELPQFRYGAIESAGETLGA